jgi:hypothetical protein
MDPSAILFPAIAMFALTASVVIYAGGSRVAAIRRRDVSIRYYRLYNEGEQPPRLQLLGRHMQNHFEMPPLFYIGVLSLYVTGGVTPLAVALAWLFFGLRCVHSFIHLGSNDVTHRFFAFALSGFVLIGIWILLLVSLASPGVQ